MFGVNVEALFSEQELRWFISWLVFMRLWLEINLHDCMKSRSFGGFSSWNFVRKSKIFSYHIIIYYREKQNRTKQIKIDPRMICKCLCNLCWLLCFGFMEDFFTESFNLCLGLALGKVAWEKPYSFFFGFRDVLLTQRDEIRKLGRH